MAGFSLTLLIFLKLISPPFPQVEAENLEGKWIYVGSDNKKETFVECPEVIFFGSNGSYEILNECYGTDRIHPVIENGNWSFDPKLRKLSLFNRKFKSNYYLYGSKAKQTFIVEELSFEKLKIRMDEGNEKVEVFEKLITKP